MPLSRLLDCSPAAYQLRSNAPGPEGSLPLTPEVHFTSRLTRQPVEWRERNSQIHVHYHHVTVILVGRGSQDVIRHALALGIDLVVHSATKYLGGHHDLTAGAVLGARGMIDALWPTQICLGATLSPMDAWLLLRGLRTLALRVRQQNASALDLARWLEQQPQVERVFHPGLASHPQHALAKVQMSGFGGVMNIVVRGGYDEASRFVHALELPRQAVSLGGVESLVVHAAAMWRGTMNDEQMRVAGIAPNAVRLSVGVEGVEDLRADLAQALAAA